MGEDTRLGQHIGHAEVAILQILVIYQVKDGNTAEAFSYDLESALSLVEPDYAECVLGLHRTMSHIRRLFRVNRMLTHLNGGTDFSRETHSFETFQDSTPYGLSDERVSYIEI